MICVDVMGHLHQRPDHLAFAALPLVPKTSSAVIGRAVGYGDPTMDELSIASVAGTGHGNRYRAAGVVYTRRLVLHPMSCELMRLIIAEDWAAAGAVLGTSFPQEWRRDGWGWLGPRVAEGEESPDLLIWGTRLARAVDAHGSVRGPVIAEAGFHGPADGSGWVEIGYRVVEGCRRRGFAEEAVTGLLEWASRHAVVGVKASVSPGNIASGTMLRKLGFAETGSYRHEDLGEQLIFRRSLEQLP